MVYVLGIDGGGTKTTGVIANSRGEKLAEDTVGSTNPNSIGIKALKDAFDTLFMSLKQQNPDAYSQIVHVFAGIAGGAHPQNKRDIKQLISSLVAEEVDVTVDNDAITALYSGTLGTPGIVQIAGTGSITYGLNDQGERDRVGGWGYLLGEEGSGYALGSDALRTSFSAYDGTGDQTELQTLICSFFQVNSVPDIVHQIYHATNIKEQIASLSRLVVEAADNEDAVAMRIVQRNGRAIGESINCLSRKLFNGRERDKGIPVVLTGGVFNRLDLFKPFIKEKIQNTMKTPDLIRPEIEPVGGAVIAALQEEGLEKESVFLSMFQQL